MESKHGTNIENAINDFSCDTFKTAMYMAVNCHRYLQNEFFKIVIKFILAMARNQEKGWYDGRNEQACKMSALIANYIRQDDELKWYAKSFDNECEEEHVR